MQWDYGAQLGTHFVETRCIHIGRRVIVGCYLRFGVKIFADGAWIVWLQIVWLHRGSATRLGLGNFRRSLEERSIRKPEGTLLMNSSVLGGV